MDRQRRLRRWLIVALPGAALLYVAIITASTVDRAIDAEYDLHALTCTLRLCEEFVVRNGRWPGSWDELAALTDVQPPSLYRWPEQRAEVEGRVTIDFNVRLDALAALSEPSEIPIRVRSTYYDWGHRYQELYDAIRRTAPPADSGHAPLE